MTGVGCRELIQRLYGNARFAPPTTVSQLAVAELALGAALPEELRSFLLVSNGATNGGLSLVWPIEKIEADNLLFRTYAQFREIYMPFDHLLFFADASNGDQFAYAILTGEIRRTDVFAWNHEDDSRKWVAPSLEKYLDWWSSGRITL